MRNLIVLALIFSIAISCKSKPAPSSPPAASKSTSVAVSNSTGANTTVGVSFGANSAVTQKDWAAFCPGSGLTCSFSLASNSARELPTGGKWLNATFAFGGPVACGTTKAEVSINNPGWYDTLDVSLVDGFSNKIKIVATGSDGGVTEIGPPFGKDGNEKVLGLFPFGCDICVARQNPPCGIAPGKDGCKGGTQYAPDVPCQWQGPMKGGGGLSVQIVLVQ